VAEPDIEEIVRRIYARPEEASHPLGRLDPDEV
jgi:hypothetical protein